jgi:hypothetical protein
MVARRDFTITNICEKCGMAFHPWQGKPGRTCSRLCANRITGPESAAKRGDMQRGKGEGKTYGKFMGRHLHRQVAESKIGRPLAEGEVVHHIDGNKLNNHPDNIAVLESQAVHARLESTGRYHSEATKLKCSEAKLKYWEHRRNAKG